MKIFSLFLLWNFFFYICLRCYIQNLLKLSYKSSLNCNCNHYLLPFDAVQYAVPLHIFAQINTKGFFSSLLLSFDFVPTRLIEPWKLWKTATTTSDSENMCVVCGKTPYSHWRWHKFRLQTIPRYQPYGPKNTLTQTEGKSIMSCALLERRGAFIRIRAVSLIFHVHMGRTFDGVACLSKWIAGKRMCTYTWTVVIDAFYMNWKIDIFGHFWAFLGIF